MTTSNRTRTPTNAPRVLRSASAAGALVALCACAGARPPAETRAAARYSGDERRSMILCVALADATWNLAHAKKRGVPKEKVLAWHESVDAADRGDVRTLMRKTIELVYAEEFDSPWDYAMGFYKDCARLAKVSPERATLGAYCAQHALIASAAYDSKKAGVSRAEVVKRFRNFESDRPRVIVERVYASSSPSRGDTLVGAWDTCVDSDTD